ncbi:MAG: DNA replication/repair protein RecF [Synergistaceae bacterium]|nr:DNA replication/repair protein RecF [Synergistaceae bacterium]
MWIERSGTRAFRCLEDGPVGWGPGLCVIVGPNGSGKSSLIESLAILLGWGPSGRGRDVPRWGDAEGRALLAASVRGETSFELEACASARVTLRLDGRRATCTDVRVAVPSLTFAPTDVAALDGPPSARRAILDRTCALLWPPYARRLAELRQISRQRGALLRQGRSPKGTDVPSAKLGGWIMEARRSAARNVAALMADGPLPVRGVSLRVVPELDQGGEAWLLRELERSAREEARAMRPLVGPSRDDLEVLYHGHVASTSLSRGQKRRLLLSLILASARLVGMRFRRAPILLFDDIAAELDARAREEVGRALADTGWQVFVTGTEHPFPSLGTSPVVVLSSPD